MNLETSLPTTPTPRAADTSSYLDAFIHSIPKPAFPSDEVYPLVTDILRATRPLLDADHDWILPNIALLEGQLLAYNTLIDRLCTVVEELKGYRHAIQIVSKRFSSILAPIRHLPSDVLRSVFRETQPRQSRQSMLMNGWPIIKLMQDPLTLGQVCGFWRDIVISSPELWSHINITFPNLRLGADDPSPCNFQTVLKTILSLSGQVALDIQFRSNGDTSSGEAIEAFSLLLGERHRWKSASLKLPLDLLEQLRASSGKLPCLESLTLMTPRLPRHSRTVPPGDVSDVFIDAPSLRKVKLHDFIGLGSFAFPCQITHLATSFTAVHDLHTLSLLEELHLEERHDGDIDFFPHITFPKVRRLSVSSPKLLRHLCLPSLEDLTFDNCGAIVTHARVDVAAATLTDFIRSSRCSLTSLATMTSIVYAPNFIQETLPMLESLTSLEFQIDNILQDSFYHTLMSPVLLPNLQHLIMRLPPPEIWGEPLLALDTLSTMLASRRQLLRSVRFDCPIISGAHSSEAAGILNTLEPLRQLGVDLRAVDVNSLAGISFGNFA
ncbi:hypothetical protein EV421DRAFT_2031170 [Armillaria borealis]|uniref:F-box domain-containing protein n=1 Tax=Armillaria borealis TaxID=47425 RepID=A0AA39K149_9AGAR|nr:hypothetical protein EV421DRAFT_2031170 [Armillaria borealis]